MGTKLTCSNCSDSGGGAERSEQENKARRLGSVLQLRDTFHYGNARNMLETHEPPYLFYYFYSDSLDLRKDNNLYLSQSTA